MFKFNLLTTFLIFNIINAIYCEDLSILFNKTKNFNLNRISKELKYEVNKYIKDPYEIKDFKINLDNALTQIKGNFSDLKLYGLNKLKLKKVKLNLIDVKLNAKLYIPKLRLNGFYDLDGKVTFFPLKGDGKFSMNITGIYIDAIASLTKNEQGILEVTTLGSDLETDSLNINFDNLFKGRWSSIYNTVLNTISNMIFSDIKYFVLTDIEEEIRKRINNELKLIPNNIFDNKSHILFDDILEKAKKSIIGRYDPFILKNQTREFNLKLFIDLHGEISLYSGEINGLSTLQRTGEILAVYNNDTVTLEANLGFENLSGSYRWYTELFGSSVKGRAILSVESISAFIKIKQSLNNENELPILEQFEITDIGHLKVDVRGIGTADYIIEIFVNLISNIFKGQLAKVISGPLKQVLQEEIHKYGKRFI